MGDVFAGNSGKSLAPDSNTRQGSGFANRRFQKLTDSDRFTLNGRLYKVVVIGNEDTAFRPPEGLSAEDNAKYGSAIAKLKEAAQPVQKMTDRLSDSEDGLTLEGVGRLIKHLDKLDDKFAENMRGYLLALLRHGGNVDKISGFVIVPPYEREKFEEELRRLPDEALRCFDTKRWLDHLYDPVPKVTEGFYLFESKNDWKKFEGLLGEEYASLKQRLHEFFKKALAGPLEQHEWKEYTETSQKLMELQTKALEPVLAQNEYARAMSTRVRISFTDTDQLSLSVTHYTEDFGTELKILAEKLRGARDALPEWASELRGVLSAQADWCLDTSRNPDWGRTPPAWIAAKDSSNLLDINVTAEERVSHIGQKGRFQIMVAQHDEISPALQKPWSIVQESASKSNVSAMLLRTLVVGGLTSSYYSGEKLPNPAGEPLYKSMIFTNTAGILGLRANAEAISAATGLTMEEVQKLAPAAILGRILHEYGHTMGDHTEFLEQYGGFVEETNAQASAVYLASSIAPELLDKVAIYEACWLPVIRALQGVLEQHSRSHLALFKEQLDAGANEIAEKDGRHIVQMRDQDLLVQTAFRTAMKMRLWEKGLPTSFHDSYIEKLDPSDHEGAAASVKKAVDFVELISQKPEKAEGLRQKALTEAKEYFSEDRMRSIGALLEPLLSGMTEIPMPMVVILSGDARMAALVA